MRYAYTFPALFAAAVIAAPVENVKRNDESLIGNDGTGYQYYHDGHLIDLADVGLLKRDDKESIGGVSVGGILKRDDESLIGSVGNDDYDDDFLGLDLLKRNDEILGGLLGGGSSSGGGSLLLRRDDESLIGSDGDHYDFEDNHLLDVGDLGLLKRTDEEFIGNDGYHDDSDLADLGDLGLLEDGEDLVDESRDVNNAKREEEVLSTDLAGFANVLKTRSESASVNDKRSEDLSIDQTNVITGANVADDVEIATPVAALANPLSL